MVSVDAYYRFGVPTIQLYRQSEIFDFDDDEFYDDEPGLGDSKFMLGSIVADLGFDKTSPVLRWWSALDQESYFTMVDLNANDVRFYPFGEFKGATGVDKDMSYHKFLQFGRLYRFTYNITVTGSISMRRDLDFRVTLVDQKGRPIPKYSVEASTNPLFKKFLKTFSTYSLTKSTADSNEDITHVLSGYCSVYGDPEGLLEQIKTDYAGELEGSHVDCIVWTPFYPLTFLHSTKPNGY